MIMKGNFLFSLRNEKPLTFFFAVERIQNVCMNNTEQRFTFQYVRHSTKCAFSLLRIRFYAFIKKELMLESFDTRRKNVA